MIPRTWVASGEMSSQPNISLNTRTTDQNTEYVSHVSNGTSSCVSLPMWFICFVRHSERSRCPGFVCSSHDPANVATYATLITSYTRVLPPHELVSGSSDLLLRTPPGRSAFSVK